jgi:hypothetical protein
MPGAAGALGGEAVGTAAGSAVGGSTAGASGVSSLFPATSSGALSAAPATSSIMLPGATSLGGASAGGAGAGAGSGMFSGGIGNFVSQNKYALAGGALGGMMAPGQEPEQPNQGNIRDYSFSQQQNPLFGQPGQAAFTNQQFTPGAVTPAEEYNRASGGIIALADGGEIQRYTQPVRQTSPEVAAYNAQIMERANQQYNVNPRPAPNQVPGSAGYTAPPAPAAIAPSTGENLSGLRFNPVTQQFEGAFAAPGDASKKSLFDDGMYRDRYYDPSNSGGGDSGGNASGGNADGGPGAGSDAGGNYAYGGSVGYNQGGISSLGSYSDGGQLLKGPGDGVSDSIPAQIGAKQPARLATNEFVVPARIVSELGNGSTDAGAKQLYAMMDRVQKARKKSIGKGKVAVDSKAHKLLPA